MQFGTFFFSLFIVVKSANFQIEIATLIHPYAKWKTPFEQLKQVVEQPSPILPSGRFSTEFEEFILKW